MKVNYLIELWLIEILKAIVKFFFNPLFYWFFIFVFILGIFRIKQERYFFGIKVFNLFYDWKRVLFTSLISGLVLSIITVGAGFVFNYDIFFVFLILLFFLSLSFFIFVVILDIYRIKQERYFFGIKVFNLFYDWKRVLFTSLISGLVLSIITVGAGFVFNYDILFVLLISTFIMSLSFNPAYLSAVYTIGLTYVLLLFLPLLNSKVDFTFHLPVNIQFTHLTILLGFFLIVEALVIKKVKNNQIPPSLK